MVNITTAAYERCSQIRTSNILSVSERRRKFILKNPYSKDVRQVSVDGCLPIESAKCDYLFEISASAQVYYVELKGKDIKHALEQLLATMSYCFFAARHINYEKTCVIVSSQVPKMTPRTQALKKQCRKKKNARLKIKTRQCEIMV